MAKEIPLTKYESGYTVVHTELYKLSIKETNVRENPTTNDPYEYASLRIRKDFNGKYWKISWGRMDI